MPRDGVACYDSGITSARDIFRSVADILSPINPLLLLIDLFR